MHFGLFVTALCRAKGGGIFQKAVMLMNGQQFKEQETYCY